MYWLGKVTSRVSRSVSMLVLATAATMAATTNDPTGPDFEREVRPVLSKYCFTCHGPDEETRKGGLRLDMRESAIAPAKSDAIAIIPGKPAESELIKRIMTDDEDDVMPPPKTKKVMSAAEKETLTKWIAAGAQYKDHWAFVAPVAKPLPAVKHEAWVRNEIDRFVLARLEKEGLTPSAEADRYTLIRRVSLDLIGLPPTPAEVDAFIADNKPGAYERLVDRLLASPHFGERWARQWLDLARYADTNGYEKDRPRSMWPWRDWVIDAINADMPFDQFTIKQFAGDLLPQATQADRIATGFNRNTMINEEGGIDPLEFRFHAMTDRMATMGKTWLGLTTMCVQCHTHKYDPLTHTEYYEVMAMMNNADEIVMPIKPPDHAKREAEVEAKVTALLPTLVDKFPVEERRWAEAQVVSVTSASGEAANIAADGTITMTGEGADKDTYTVTIETTSDKFDLIEFVAFADRSNPEEGPGRSSSGNFVLSEISVSVGAKDSKKNEALKISSITADTEQDGFAANQAIDGKPTTGWAVDDGKDMFRDRTAVMTLKSRGKVKGAKRVVITLDQQYGKKHVLKRFRLRLGYDEDANVSVATRRAAAAEAFATWQAEQRNHQVRWQVLTPIKASSDVPTLTVLEDGSVLSSGDITKRDVYKNTYAQQLNGVTAIRIEALTHDSLPAGGPGRAYYEGERGDFLINEIVMTVDDKEVSFTRADQTYAKGEHNASKTFDRKPLTGWTIGGSVGKDHAAMLVCSEPISGKDTQIELVCERYFASAIGRYRISVTTDTPPERIAYLPDAIASLVMKDPATLSDADKDAMYRYWLANAPELEKARSEIRNLEKSLDAYPTTLVFVERPAEHPRATHLHNRGEFLQPKQQVEPGIFKILNALPKDAPKNRLGLAQWLMARDNPLTARVTINRWWATLFGRGIVSTIDDFGFQGAYPTHPDLLDWMAVRFMEDGWSVKQTLKRFVMSATYRQSSIVTPELLAKDPANKLLARGPRFRIEAEMIRDSLLTASGQLSPKLKGPSVFPPQPAGVASEGAYGRFEWKESKGEDRYRRGLYTYMKRTAPYAMTQAFDAPSGEVCVAKREVSNSPLQALMLLNDTMVMEAAQALGKIIATSSKDDATRITTLVRRCLVRPPTTKEQEAMTRFITNQRKRLAAKELKAEIIAGTKDGDVNEIAVWTTLARAVMNTDEFVSKE